MLFIICFICVPFFYQGKLSPFDMQSILVIPAGYVPYSCCEYQISKH